MLLGRPPFETTNLKETYRCIREARYSMPSTLSPQAKHLISSMLAKSPEDRLRLDDILCQDFFSQVSESNNEVIFKRVGNYELQFRS